MRFEDFSEKKKCVMNLKYLLLNHSNQSSSNILSMNFNNIPKQYLAHFI